MLAGHFLRAPPDGREALEGADRGAADAPPPPERPLLGALTPDGRLLGAEWTPDDDGRRTDAVGFLDVMPREPTLGLDCDGAVRGTITGPGEVALRPVGGSTRLLGDR